ncbi:MAG: tetratricopeptide repeat protein [Halioglobus sp.]
MAKQPITLENAMALAKQSADKGDIPAARNLYKKVLESAPGYKPARKALKNLPRGSGSSRLNKPSFRQDMDALMAITDSGQLDTAMSEAKRLAKKYPTQPMPLNVQGTILIGQEKDEEAVAVLKKAYKLAPDYDNLLHNLGQALTLTGDHEEALDIFNKALKLNPRDALALTYKGNLLREAYELDKAAQCLEEALEIDPYSANAQHYCGMVLSNKGANNAALAHLRNAIDIEPGNISARLSLGMTLTDMKLYVAAVDELVTATEMQPNNYQAQYRLGMALFQKGDEQAAAKALQRAIELNPEADEAHHYLAIAEGKTTDSAPRRYVQDVFDGYASSFERTLVDDLGYDGPAILRKLLDETNESTDLRVLDIGCGTGLTGLAFKDITRQMTGVDLSSRMLKEAKKKSIYSDLVCEDVVAWLQGQEEQFDLFIAADMLIYVGRLEPVFEEVRSHCHEGARFAITTELLNESDDEMQLLSTGRYAHSNGYVERVAEQHGFDIEAYRSAPLRKEGKGWLEGGYYILKAR